MNITVSHKNDLRTYWGNWANLIRMITPNGHDRYSFDRIPLVIESLATDQTELEFVLSHLHDHLSVIETTQISSFDYLSYAESRVFLKMFFVSLRVVLDNVNGVIEYLYKINRDTEPLSPSFAKTLRNALQNRLSPNLKDIFINANQWFPEFTKTRNDLVHY